MDDNKRMIDCQNLLFSPELAEARMAKAEGIFGRSVLRRILCFALFLLGGNRRAFAQMLGISFESVKTSLRVLHRDGLAAFEDRRRAASTFLPLPTVGTKITVCEESEYVVIELGQKEPVKIPRDNTVQIRTFVLSLVNAGLISTKSASNTLHLSSAYIRDLAKELDQEDVGTALLDKRRGQIQQYRMTPETTALLIQQFAAHAVTGRSTSSIALADELHVPDRTIRVHARKLGFSTIVNSLPELVSTLKKKSKQ